MPTLPLRGAGHGTVPLARRQVLALVGAGLLAGVPCAARAEPNLQIESSETDGALQGTVRAVSAFSFAAVAQALGSPEHWCGILMLHLNNKACTRTAAPDGAALALAIARKHDQDAAQAHALVLQWRLREHSAQRLVVTLDAPAGPFGTTDYAVRLTAEPAGERTAIVFSYGCRFGRAARLGMQAYFATLGRDKVGFSSAPGAGGSERLVGGLRGLVERTAMRYHLAIEAWLHAATLPAPQRAQARMERWFDATERHPRQLRELDKASYLAQKRRELGIGP